MVLWRISNHADLNGIGGELSDGRWHTARAAKRIVYLSEHPAVALVENLANLRGNPRFFRQHFQLLRVTSQSGLPVVEVSPELFPPAEGQNRADTQNVGDAWLADKTSALLRVPSFPSPESWNYLLNPLHPDAAFLNIEWAKHIVYDKRLSISAVDPCLNSPKSRP